MFVNITAASVGNDLKAYETYIYNTNSEIRKDNDRFNACNASALGGITAIADYYSNFNAHITGGGIDNSKCSS